MNIKFITQNIISISLIILSLILFFFGFYIREISNGAANTDFQFHIWPLINDFNENYFFTLKNYLSYKEATFPFYHSFQSFFNPFKSSYIAFTFSNTILNLLILVIFFYYLKKKLINNEKFLIFVIPFIFLLSPWFRSTSYWGTTENFALFFLIPSCFYLNELFKNNQNLKINLLLTLFIALTIYSRQQFLFLAFTHISILIINRNIKNFLYICSIYALLAIPGLYTYYLWDAFSNLKNSTSASDYISLKNIFNNIPKISSLIFFYSIPILIINYKKFIDIFRTKKFILTFFSLLIVQYILFKDISYSEASAAGGGYLIKLNKIFFNNTMYFLIIISSFLFSLIFFFRKLINYKYFILLFFIFIIIGLPEYIYQEWFDPIYLIFYYMIIPYETIKDFKLDKKKSIYFLFFWEFLILITAMVYHHFYLDKPLFYSF